MGARMNNVVYPFLKRRMAGIDQGGIAVLADEKEIATRKIIKAHREFIGRKRDYIDNPIPWTMALLEHYVIHGLSHLTPAELHSLVDEMLENLAAESGEPLTDPSVPA